MTENEREAGQGGRGADSASAGLGADRAENGRADSLPRCTATCVDGERCKGQALAGQATCLFHSPGAEALLTDARRRGGLTRSAMLEPVELGIGELDWGTAEGLLAIIAAVAVTLLAGRIDAPRARAISELASRLLANLRGEGSTEARLAAVEKALREVEAGGGG